MPTELFKTEEMVRSLRRLVAIELKLGSFVQPARARWSYT
jgi:hypothetical protein